MSLIYDDHYVVPKYAHKYKKIEYYVDENGCWICTSHAKDPDGYIMINRGKHGRLHRYVYGLEKGELKDGEVVMHKCDNPSCFNPSHLEVGTNVDNQRDKVEKGRQAKGRKNGRAKLTESDVLAIRNDKRSARELARIYGVSHPNILDIKHRRTWTYLEEASE